VDELLVAAGAAADAKGVLRPLRAEVQEVVQARAYACMQRDWHALPSFLRLRFATLLTLSPRRPAQRLSAANHVMLSEDGKLIYLI
jgi:hypothetical protein